MRPELPPPSASADDAARERTLINRARAGDEAAFGELMANHHAALHRVVRAILRHDHDADDACQDAWVTAWRRLPDYRGEAALATWLRAIAVRRALDALRRRRGWLARFLPFQRDPEDRAGAPEPTAPDDSRASVLAAESAVRLTRALAILPPRLRATLALREIEGLPYEEIARTLECPVGTVMSRLHKARRLLTRHLQENPSDADSPP
jgi:RNA polymerase sigma-70 factor, ECF subfamily